MINVFQWLLPLFEDNFTVLLNHSCEIAGGELTKELWRKTSEVGKKRLGLENVTGGRRMMCCVKDEG